MKKYKKGLVLGKFMPVHYGHLYLVEQALMRCEQVHILIYTLKEQIIPGELRHSWMCKEFESEIKAERVKIKWVEKDLPQLPEEHESFWDIWCDEFQQYIEEPNETCILGEQYTQEFAEKLGIHFEVVDNERNIVPICATEIRADSEKYWTYIPKSVKSYFTKRYVLLGPESCGKSTLTRQLARVFQGEFVEEYGREFVEKYNKSTDFTAKELGYIALMHENRIYEKLKLGNKRLFVDTDIITTQVFSELYLGYIPQLLSSYEEMTTVFDQYYLLYPDTEFQQDGTRNESINRLEHFNLLKDALDKRSLPYSIIRGEDKLGLIKQKILEFEGSLRI